MKYLLPAILVFALYLQPLYPVFAQATSTSPATLRQQRIQERKTAVAEKIDSVKERVASREAALKTKLAKFKDKKKALVAERVGANLSKVNEKRTTHYTNVLTKLTDILARLEARVNQASAGGKDTTAAVNAIGEARVSIASAKIVVDAQSAKEYTITATSEAKIRSDAQAVRDNLHTDLKATHALVVIARQSVAEAISTTVSSLGGGKNGK